MEGVSPLHRVRPVDDWSPSGMQTQVLFQTNDGSWSTSKTYPNPLLAYIAARKLSRQEQRPCRTVCTSGQLLEEIQPS
jgi:hypothetical protein